MSNGTPPPSPAIAAGADALALVAPERLARMPRHIYRLRILGMGLGGIAIAAVLREHDAGWPLWTLWAGTALLWPHLALWIALRSAHPYRAEVRNLLFDSLLAGLWAPLMHFDLLPSVLLLTLATVDKISTGIPRLWLYSLPAAAAGMAAGALASGLAFAPATSMAVILACLPMLLIHTIAVSLAANRLIGRIRRQNHELDLLQRIDALTGLDGRRHWQQRAEAVLRERQAGGPQATLLMVDIDRFKQINDEYGHASGDDILRLVASTLRRRLSGHDCAGRFGGDEFAVILHGLGADSAHAVAEGMRRDVEAASAALPHLAGPACTVSIGLAEAGPRHARLRDWIESADAALYAAKHAGRNRVASG
ncbi:sensor domain-containing diguanylate cyclase [Pseudoxanthomonas sp.]|uniref:sensor domain-containing diguanylate cyclase n=1 Tax=Pseudoxanthomonas sp. TaxID=1871049 RepID=UPI002587A573|nr:sensor domain-containing diguanylate cyclase [Pseudoxanthomonas sp.]MCR6686977.1 diguanylate cyclase [Pseudoxanthomonas sp.]